VDPEGDEGNTYPTGDTAIKSGSLKGFVIPSSGSHTDVELGQLLDTAIKSGSLKGVMILNWGSGSGTALGLLDTAIGSGSLKGPYTFLQYADTA